MDLVNKEVVHGTFGKGNVINYDDSYININFESGEKKFSFPDVFKDYITFVDEEANDIVNGKIELKEEEKRQEKLRIEREKELEKERIALEEERLYIEAQKKRIRSNVVHSKIQSVFWCDPEEEEEIFTEWKVFTGKIKSGKKKGQPRQLARMNENSACLITRRTEDMPEEDRKILGFFMASESFDGRECEDGYIVAHPEYRIQLTEEESEEMLFWKYYFDEKAEDETLWKSGRQRYFDNNWMAQILRDVVRLRENSEEKEDAEKFYEYFCRVNFINPDNLAPAGGPLADKEDKEENKKKTE